MEKDEIKEAANIQLELYDDVFSGGIQTLQTSVEKVY